MGLQRSTFQLGVQLYAVWVFCACDRCARCVELRTRVTNSDVRDCVEERIRKLDDGGSGAPHCYRY